MRCSISLMLTIVERSLPYDCARALILLFMLYLSYQLLAAVSFAAREKEINGVASKVHQP